MNNKQYRTVGIEVVAFRTEDIVSTSAGTATTDGYALDIYKSGWEDENVKS